MPPMHPIPQWLTEEYHNGIMTWILVDTHFGVYAGATTYALGGVYVPRWERFNPIRRWLSRLSRRKNLLIAWLIRNGQKVYRILKFMRLIGYSKPPTPKKRKPTLAMLVGMDKELTETPTCKLLMYDPSRDRGIWLTGQVIGTANNPYEIMDMAANQYPGIMLGLPWANKPFVVIKSLVKPAMWGFWLALLALAWNAINEWVR